MKVLHAKIGNFAGGDAVDCGRQDYVCLYISYGTVVRMRRWECKEERGRRRGTPTVLVGFDDLQVYHSVPCSRREGLDGFDVIVTVDLISREHPLCIVV